MKFKIGNVIFDSSDQPLMVILSDDDKTNIANMACGDDKYCVFDSSKTSVEEAAKFMKVIDPACGGI